MTQDHHNCTSPCDVCGLRQFERNRYFDGKLMVTRDFEAEQDYLKGKTRLHSSMLHGYGTVCGLRIDEHRNPACNHQFVELNPGLALDCCGREIIVPELQAVDLRAKIEEALRARERFRDGNPEPTNIFVRLAYQECDAEKVPALLDDCGCGEPHAEFNRTRESYRLFVDLDPPATEASDPLEARLEWQHTLSVAHPRALAVDRQLMRLYVAEWDGTSGWLRMYDASNHSLVHPRLPVGDQPPTAIARSNLGDLVYVAQAAGAGDDARIAIFSQNLLESDPATAQRAGLTVSGGVNIVRLAVSPLDDSLFALIADGRLLRWSSNSVRSWVEAHDADPPPDPNDQPAPTVQDLSDALAEGAEGDAVAPVDLSISPAGRWMVVADSGAPRLIALNLSQFGQAVPLVNRVRSFVLPEGDTPGSVEISYDGDYLYILCPGSQRLYRARLRDELASLIPIIPDEGQDFSMLPLVNAPVAGAPPNPLPLDVSVSPRDNWVYILRRLFNPDGSPRDRGDIIIVDAQGMNENPGMTGISEEMARELRQQGSFINGNALFHQLAFLGQRVYAAGETPTEPAEGEEEPPESTEGSISILFVNEAACDTFIRKTVDGCSPCPDPNQGVVIASIQGYLWNQPMVNEQVADQNFIDNYTHRQMVPSTNTLRQVIECMLDKGISEGIPGPRGAVGPEGRRGQGIVEVSADTLNPGSPATASLEPVNPDTDPQGDQRLNLGLPRGDAGQRGPGIREVLVRPLSAGQPPTAGLTPIPDHPLGDQTLDLGLPPGAGITDVAVETGPLNARLEPIDPANPNGDQRLILTIPQGESGEAGPPGPGITQVTVQTLPPGSNATASLTPIPGDPQGNQRLNLGIPRGAQGPPGVVEPGNFNQVVAASWHHEQIMTTQEFARLVVSGIGLSVVFREPVRTITLHSRSAYLLVSRAESGGILGSLVCQCILPTEVRRFSEGSTNPETIRWLVGLDQVLRDEFELVRNLDGGPLEDTDDFARVVQLVLPENFQDPSALESMIGEMRELTGRRFLTLSVVLKGDWIIDENGNALDGNNIWPGVPEQPTATGLPGRLSGNGTQGDDWISLIHIRSVQD